MKPGDQDSGILVVPQVTTFAADAVVLAVSTWRSDRGVRSGVMRERYYARAERE
jgi:hypothetical protein